MIQLANQTSVQAETSADGTADIPMIPIGTFTAKVSYIGTATTVSGDASQLPNATAKILSSVPTLVLVAFGAIAAVVTVVILVRKRRGLGEKRTLPP